DRDEDHQQRGLRAPDHAREHVVAADGRAQPVLGARRLLRPEQTVRAAQLAEAERGEQWCEDRHHHEDPRDHEAGDEHAALQADALPQLLDDREAVPPRGPHLHSGYRCRIAHQYLTRGSRIAATMSTKKLVSATITAS